MTRPGSHKAPDACRLFRFVSAKRVGAGRRISACVPAESIPDPDFASIRPISALVPSTAAASCLHWTRHPYLCPHVGRARCGGGKTWAIEDTTVPATTVYAQEPARYLTMPSSEATGGGDGPGAAVRGRHMHIRVAQFVCRRAVLRRKGRFPLQTTTPTIARLFIPLHQEGTRSVLRTCT